MERQLGIPRRARDGGINIPDTLWIREGEWSLMFFGGALSHAVLKAPASGDFRVQMEFGGTAAAATPPADAAAFARVDIVVSKRRGPLLMELEVIEPELFLASSPAAPAQAARAVLKYLKEIRR